MEKLILFSIILFFVNGACTKEVENPYRDVFGAYDGGSRVLDSTKYISYFCEGSDLMIKDLGNDNVLITTFCRTAAFSVSVKESFNEFKNLKVGKSRVETIDLKRWGSSGEDSVSFSLIDTKTNKEVGYFYKNPTRPYFFYADSLLSTKGVYLRGYRGVKK